MLTPSLMNDLLFLLLQYLDDEKYTATAHKLEQESALLFNMNYFEEKVMAGDWDEVERYLSGFTRVDENRHSTKIYFNIRKQRFLEVLDKNDMAKAVELLRKDLKVFSTINEEIYKEITQIITLDNFRQHPNIADYVDAQSNRSMMMSELKTLIQTNPVLRNKLKFPALEPRRLKDLINQSLNMQHAMCQFPAEDAKVETVYKDHTCDAPCATTPVPPPVAAVPRPATYAPLSFPPAGTAPNAFALAGRMANATAYSFRQPADFVLALPAPVLANQGQHVQPFPPAGTAPNAFGLPGRMANATASSSGPAAVFNASQRPRLQNQAQRLQPFPPASTAPNTSVLPGWMANATASSIDRAAVSSASPRPRLENQVSMLNWSRTTPNTFYYQKSEHEKLMEHLQSAGQTFTDEVAYPPHRQPQWSVDDLPRTVLWAFHQGSSVTSLDFHPSHHTLVLGNLTPC